jgi:hypothetical protein
VTVANLCPARCHSRAVDSVEKFSESIEGPQVCAGINEVPPVRDPAPCCNCEPLNLGALAMESLAFLAVVRRTQAAIAVVFQLIGRPAQGACSAPCAGTPAFMSICMSCCNS